MTSLAEKQKVKDKALRPVYQNIELCVGWKVPDQQMRYIDDCV
jgi:hypothetical protein